MKFIAVLLTLVLSQITYANPLDCRDADWSEALQWAKSFNESYGTTLRGKTLSGNTCELNVFPSPFNKEMFYISHGSSRSGRDGAGDFSYIGTFINPGPKLAGHCIIKALEITDRFVHIQTQQEEAGAPGVVEHDILIRLDSQGIVEQAQASSSYWPGSSCIFE